MCFLVADQGAALPCGSLWRRFSSVSKRVGSWGLLASRGTEELGATPWRTLGRQVPAYLRARFAAGGKVRHLRMHCGAAGALGGSSLRCGPGGGGRLDLTEGLP